MCTHEILFGDISWWTIWIVVGVGVCLLLFDKLCAVRKLTPAANRFYYLLGIISIVIGFLSASLVQSVYNYIASGKWSWGGVTFMGGLFGGVIVFVLGGFIFSKGEVRAQFVEVCEIGLACIPTAHAFGRIGCFSVGCCYGAKVEEGDPFAFLGVVFKHGAGAGVLRYPTQLIEAVFLFILAGLTILFVIKNKKINFPLYFGGYGIFRFMLEFLRDDARGSIGTATLSPSQVLSIVCMVMAVLWVVFMALYKFRRAAAEKIIRFVKLDNASTGGWVPYVAKKKPKKGEPGIEEKTEENGKDDTSE